MKFRFLTMTITLHLASENPFFLTAIGEAIETEGFSLSSGDSALVLWDTDSLESPPQNTRALGLGKREPKTAQAWLETPVTLSRLAAELRRALADRQETLALTAEFQLHPQDRLLNFLPADGTIALTEKECELLAALHAHGTMTRPALLESVWGYREAVDTHTLETHLHRLRAKIRDIAGEAELILTTPSGYGLNR